MGLEAIRRHITRHTVGLVKDKDEYLVHIEHTSSKWLNIVVFERVKSKHDCASNFFITALYTPVKRGFMMNPGFLF